MLLPMPWQVNVCHHATCAAAAYTFEQGQRRFDDSRVLFNGLALFCPKSETRRSGNREGTARWFRLKLKNIPGKLQQLLLVDRDDFPARGTESLEYDLSFGWIQDRIGTNNARRSPMLIIMSVCLISCPLPLTAANVTGL